MKKMLFSFALLLSLIGLGACRPSQTTEGSSKPRVAVTTSFLNDMVYQLVGDEVERDLLIPAGEDPHGHTIPQPTMVNILRTIMRYIPFWVV